MYIIGDLVFISDKDFATFLYAEGRSNWNRGEEIKSAPNGMMGLLLNESLDSFSLLTKEGKIIFISNNKTYMKLTCIK